MWIITSEYCCSCAPPRRRISLLERKLACLRFFSITGRALVAPLTWLAVTLLTGTYYECAASEFASVDHYPVFENVSASKREEILAGFPCCKSAPSDMMLVRDEVALLHRYQSQMLGWILITLATTAALVSSCLARCCSPLTSLQHCYWTNHLHNERELFEQAAEQHSRLLIMQRIKKLFGFIPGNEDIKHIRTRRWSRPLAQQPRDTKEPGIQKRRTTRTSLSVDNELHIRPPLANYPIANRKPEATEFTGAPKSRRGNTVQPRRQPRYIERGGREEWLRWRRP
ncbi:Calcium Homeostasis Modulator Protein 4 [Manis pentadactyla]|nr:Calcium Homeostasis Modulator Protein 4 [Manis pentadactyla]